MRLLKTRGNMKRLFSFFIMLAVAFGYANDHVCLTYFTQLGCQGCAQTDQSILHTWLQEMSQLVVIEYVITEKDNQYVFLEYSKKFEHLSSVPQISYDGKNAVGPVEILSLKHKFKAMEEAECTLLDEEFDEMDLNKLPGMPRIWWRDRVLMKEGKGTIKSDEMRELFFSREVEAILKDRRIETQKVLLSGNEINFKRAYQIADGWIIQVGAQLLKEPLATEEEALQIKMPLIGTINHEHSLVVLTVLLGLADGFNPCAFFILTFLLATMLYAASESITKREKRNRILLVGLTFVFFSALIYFLFMGLWFNVFKFLNHGRWLTWVAGLIALFAGFINIKDYFFFQKGFSCTLPKSEKLKFVDKVERLKTVRSWIGLFLGTIIVAITVNLYELLCTLGIPMVYLRLLTLHNLSLIVYYVYVALYCFVYIVPLLIIVLIFAFTLGAREFSLQNVKRLKLISGFMVLFLGFILLFNPALLKSGLISLGIVAGAIVLALIVMAIYEYFCNKLKSNA